MILDEEDRAAVTRITKALDDALNAETQQPVSAGAVVAALATFVALTLERQPGPAPTRFVHAAEIHHFAVLAMAMAMKQDV
jgi:hypothetical protein